ncbi:MAG: mechanosensitive ion channel [Saprospiraceae bacterium]|nr:mechanosensitive ion channel [Saprospiraceae bacterium]
MEKWLEKITELAINYAPDVLLAIITLVVGLWVISGITRLFQKFLDKREVDPTVQPVLKTLVSWGLKVLLFISVAGIFGVETTSFVAAIGALAFAVGMALQGSLGHFASGILLLVLKPYKTGDVVEIAGVTGVVHSIQVFNTLITTFDNQRVVIPNGVVTSGIIKNINTLEDRRIDMVFGISYEDDIDKAKEIIRQTISECEHILPEKPVQIFVSSLGDSSVNIAARPWSKAEHYWDIYWFCQENVKKNFDKSGISIPYPQMDVHLDK